MKSKLCSLLLLLFVSSEVLFAQGQKIDSLSRKLKSYKRQDIPMLKTLINLADEYQYHNPPRGVALSDTAITIAQSLKNNYLIAMAFVIKGQNSYRIHDYKNALSYARQALNIYEKGTKNYQLEISRCYAGMASAYLDQADFTEALQYYQKALAIDDLYNYKIAKEGVLANMGILYKNMGDYEKALSYYQQALSISEKLGLVRQKGITVGNMASAYLDLNRYPQALDYNQKALTISIQLSDSPFIRTNISILAKIYDDMGDYDKGMSYTQKALEIDKQLDDSINIARDLFKIGYIYTAKGNLAKALEYDTLSIKICKSLGFKSQISNLLNNIGFIYYQLHNYQDALHNYRQGLAIAEETQNKMDINLIYLSIGELYRDIPDSIFIDNIRQSNHFDSALYYLNKGNALAKSIGSLRWQMYAWDDLSQTYDKQQNHSAAFATYKNYIELRDSMSNDKTKNEINRLEIKNEFQKQEDSIQFQEQITETQLKDKQQQLALDQKELDLSNKEKDLQKLAYLKTQTDLQNEQLEKQKDDKQLTIAQKEKELQNSQVKNLSQQQALSKLKLQQQWLYSIGILILLGLLTSYFIYRDRLKEGRLKMELAKEKAEQEMKEAEFQRNLADVSLTALRSQMNPHFIFNCLNSIKLYTTQNDTIAAVEYLTKFSKLIRLVMENSRNDRISLSSELQALRLYIEMEAMRFKEKLKYSINVDNNVEADYIEIPPLLLQPYVENAIWHGLMHKEEGGKITINVAMKTSESLLEINIIDNGIGRAKSAELKSKTATLHKSYGMKVTSERIALINQIYKAGANVTIHDVTDAEGKPNGTRVTIQIPV